MRVVLQRVNHGSVRVDGKVIAEIDLGMVILLGIGPDDGNDQIDYMVNKIANLASRTISFVGKRLEGRLGRTPGMEAVVVDAVRLGDR